MVLGIIYGETSAYGERGYGHNFLNTLVPTSRFGRSPRSPVLASLSEEGRDP